MRGAVARRRGTAHCFGSAIITWSLQMFHSIVVHPVEGMGWKDGWERGVGVDGERESGFDSQLQTSEHKQRNSDQTLSVSIYPFFPHSFIHLFRSIIKPTLLYLHLEC